MSVERSEARKCRSRDPLCSMFLVLQRILMRDNASREGCLLAASDCCYKSFLQFSREISKYFEKSCVVMNRSKTSLTKDEIEDFWRKRQSAMEEHLKEASAQNSAEQSGTVHVHV